MSAIAIATAAQGWSTEKRITPTTAPSSSRLSTMFENGSGEALTASRKPALPAWLARAVEPPRHAGKASFTSCASPASVTTYASESTAVVSRRGGTDRQDDPRRHRSGGARALRRARASLPHHPGSARGRLLGRLEGDRGGGDAAGRRRGSARRLDADRARP